MLFYFQQLDREDQGCVGRDLLSGTTLAVAEVVRDIEFVFGAYRHQLQALCPTFDNTVERELDGLAALVAAVEDRTVDECALIVHFDRLLGGRTFAFALFDNLVLETALGSVDTVAQCVLLQELLAFRFGIAVLHGVDDGLYILACCLHVQLVGVVETASVPLLL